MTPSSESAASSDIDHQNDPLLQSLKADLPALEALLEESESHWGDRETPGLQQDLGEYLPLFKFFVDYLDGRIAGGG